MKKTKLSSLALLALACALIICAFAGVVTSADGETAPKAEIFTANVAYNDMVQLAFTVKTTDALPEGAVVGIMTWAADATEFTPATASYYTFESSEKDGKVYFKTLGIPAPEMDTPIYVAAIYKEDGVITVAETPFKYSALQYAGKRLTEFDVTANQADVYENLIKYGMNSDVIFENSQNYAFVKAVNGTVGSAGADIGGWAGLEVLLRADAKNADGEYFLYWQNAAGESISTSRLTYVTAPESGIDVYTAVFGDKAASLYESTFDFEALDTGDVAIVRPNVANAPNVTSYGPTKKCWNTTTTVGNMSISGVFQPVVDESKNAIMTDGVYTIDKEDIYRVTESLNGNKSLFFDQEQHTRGPSVSFTGAPDNATSVEADITYLEDLRGGVDHTFLVYLKDTDGTTLYIRVNISLNWDGDSFSLYAEGRKSSLHVPLGKSFGLALGATNTLGFALDPSTLTAKETTLSLCQNNGNYIYLTNDNGEYVDAEGNVVDASKRVVATTTGTVYTCDVKVIVNGECVGSFDLLDFTHSSSYSEQANKLNPDGKNYFSIVDESGNFNCSLFRLSIGTVKDTNCPVDIDNVTFYAGSND